MYPHERSLVKQLADKPFALIGVNSDQDLEELREVVKKKNLTWRSFQNEKGVDGKISEEWGIKGWPTLFVIDGKGVIRWRGGSAGKFDGVIEDLMDEMGHEVKIKSVAAMKADTKKDADGSKAKTDSKTESKDSN